MPQLVTSLIVLLGLLLALNIFLRANPGGMAVALRWVVGGGSVVLGLAALSRGLFPFAIAVFLAAAMALGGGGRLAEWMQGNQRPTGQSSRVRTKILAMELNHDSGSLDGRVIAGSHVGRALSELSLAELMEVRRDCLEAGDQSARLLDTFLDRVHEGWRDIHAGDAAGQGGAGRAMTAAEAYEILGLGPGAGKSDIRKAHRTLMKKFHPDHGGSEYLAQKINEARDLLLDGAR